MLDGFAHDSGRPPSIALTSASDSCCPFFGAATPAFLQRCPPPPSTTGRRFRKRFFSWPPLLPAACPPAPMGSPWDRHRPMGSPLPMGWPQPNLKLEGPCPSTRGRAQLPETAPRRVRAQKGRRPPDCISGKPPAARHSSLDPRGSLPPAQPCDRGGDPVVRSGFSHCLQCDSLGSLASERRAPATSRRLRPAAEGNSEPRAEVGRTRPRLSRFSANVGQSQLKLGGDGALLVDSRHRVAKFDPNSVDPGHMMAEFGLEIGRSGTN